MLQTKDVDAHRDRGGQAWRLQNDRMSPISAKNAMKTVLDLIREFGALSDSKARRGGRLAPRDAERWEELNAFYELLMTQSGPAARRASGHRPSASDLRGQLVERKSLRVSTHGTAIVHHGGGSLTARVINLGRGGVFLSSDTLFPAGIRTSVYLADIPGAKHGEILKLEGRVVWLSEQGMPDVSLPRGMGISFVSMTPEQRDRLDSLVLGILERQHSDLW